MEKEVTKTEKLKKRLFEILQIGNRYDVPSTLFDYFIVAVIFLNIFVVFYETYDSAEKYMDTLYLIEAGTSIIFVIEYVLRLWTANYLYPNLGTCKSMVRFIFSFYGIIDLLSFLPFFLPISFISGAVAFRMLRVARVFHLFKINSQYDAFNVVIDVIKEKRQQLFSSICLILIMMLASSLLMYGLEHEAQPEVFENAFSGIWWSVSTLLTVGYGDIYPITLLGKLMGIVIAFLGVGMVAIPTGIISAGFVEQYTKMKSLTEVSYGDNLKYLMLHIEIGHPWVGKELRFVELPPEFFVVSIVRNGNQIVVPQEKTLVQENDYMIIGALEYQFENMEIQLKEIEIFENHIWSGKMIRDLEIEKNQVVVAICRNKRAISPKPNTILKQGDLITICESK